jgi:hypothetical protein
VPASTSTPAWRSAASVASANSKFSGGRVDQFADRFSSQGAGTRDRTWGLRASAVPAPCVVMDASVLSVGMTPSSALQQPALLQSRHDSSRRLVRLSREQGQRVSGGIGQRRDGEQHPPLRQRHANRCQLRLAGHLLAQLRAAQQDRDLDPARNPIRHAHDGQCKKE